MRHKELRRIGHFRAPLKLTLRPNTPIYERRVCLGTIDRNTLPYILPNSPYKTAVGTSVSYSILNISFIVRNRSAFWSLVGTVGHNEG